MKEIGEICITFSGGTPSRSKKSYYGQGYPWIKSGELNQKKVFNTKEQITKVAIDESSARLVEPGTNLVALYGATAGVVGRSMIKAAINQAVLAVIPKSTNEIDNSYLFYALDYYMPQSLRNLQGAQPNLSGTIVKKIKLPVYQLSEQKKITEILGACDEAIEAQQKVIELKEKRLKGWMQKLLTGKVRFPQFAKSSWVDEELGNLIKHVFRPIELNPDTELNLVSVRRRSGGIFKRPSIKGNDYKTKDLHELKENDLLISKRQVTHGALALVVREYAGCLVSKEYTIFENISPSSIHMGFLGWLSKMPRFWHLAYLASNGVVIEKLIFVPKDFLRNKIFLPRTVKEQEEISCFLCELESELNLEKDKLSQLKLQKKSLMQKLLTGKVRVKVDGVVEDSR
jgi:type I restriction enzyme S subunit